MGITRKRFKQQMVSQAEVSELRKELYDLRGKVAEQNKQMAEQNKQMERMWQMLNSLHRSHHAEPSDRSKRKRTECTLFDFNLNSDDELGVFPENLLIEASASEQNVLCSILT